MGEIPLEVGADLHVTVPFWLAAAPRPVTGEARSRVLSKAAERLNISAARLPAPDQQRGNTILRWHAEPMKFSQDLSGIDLDVPWYPRNITATKKFCLRASVELSDLFQDFINNLNEHLSKENPELDHFISIESCSIYYFDYGIGSIDYVFSLVKSPKTSSLLEISQNFWQKLRYYINDAIYSQEFPLLNELYFRPITHALSAALLRSIEDEDAHPHRRPSLKLHQSRTIDLGATFLAHREKVQGAIICSHGVNFLLYASEYLLKDRVYTESENAIEACVKSIVASGLVNSDGSSVPVSTYRAASPYLLYSIHGADASLIIVNSRKNDKCSQGVREASHSLLRLLWMFYGTLHEASLGLISTEVRWGFESSTTSLLSTSETDERLLRISHARQVAQLMLSDSNPVFYWESELEQDIYHRGHLIWAMPDVKRAFSQALDAVTDLEDGLHRKADGKTRRVTRIVLSAIAVLTLVSAAADALTLEEKNNIATIAVATACALVIFLIWRNERRSIQL